MLIYDWGGPSISIYIYIDASVMQYARPSMLD